MLIGFAGKRHAGKTTAAKVAIETFGFSHCKFAGALKEVARSGYGLTIDQTDGDLKETPTPLLNGRTPRDLMEWLGEESRRQFGEGIWVNRWFAAHGDQIAGNCVFDDVRNEIESSAIQARGGIVIRVTNDRADMASDLPSERGIKDIVPDFVIHNTMDDRFDARVHALLSGLLAMKAP